MTDPSENILRTIAAKLGVRIVIANSACELRADNEPTAEQERQALELAADMAWLALESEGMK